MPQQVQAPPAGSCLDILHCFEDTRCSWTGTSNCHITCEARANDYQSSERWNRIKYECFICDHACSDPSQPVCEQCLKTDCGYYADCAADD